MEIVAYGDLSIVDGPILDNQEDSEVSNYDFGKGCNHGCPYCACDDWYCDDHCAD
ncbi:MAG: hypothetical protein MJZ24_07130 [Paludibacteraceae bacterium]|nr:hypothetical protein [Paludibacteraceae bacterium]